MTNKGKKFFIAFSVLFAFCLVGLIAGLSSDFIGVKIPTSQGVDITGNVSNEDDAKECVNQLDKNYRATNESNIENYLKTIVPAKREKTKEDIEGFFQNYKVENSIVSFKILSQNSTSLRAEASQKSVLVSAKAGADEYKNHISTIDYEFQKINNEWLIDSTQLIDNHFI
jgi:hypothetical protein